ncbi:hypothetical protein LTR22_026842 [Elasticomyces elasticus]|nr:hypothetical protein LTR22_026842 [Elasticomyces elasticus]
MDPLQAHQSKNVVIKLVLCIHQFQSRGLCTWSSTKRRTLWGLAKATDGYVSVDEVDGSIPKSANKASYTSEARGFIAIARSQKRELFKVFRVLLVGALNGPAFVEEDAVSGSLWFPSSTEEGLSGNDEMPIAHGDPLVVNASTSHSSRSSCP